MAVQPAVYGASERPPRGDYTRAADDYTCAQNWAAYTAQDHDTYHRLYLRQCEQLPGLASAAFIAALPQLGAKERIPRFDDINERLYKATRWQLVAVPGLIPEVPFFQLLANRKFPVTDWIRRPEEFEYIVEPDVFHDLFGHVPLLFNPMLADYMQRYGEGGLKAARLGSCEMLARLWPQQDGRRRVVAESTDMGVFIDGLSSFGSLKGGYGRMDVMLPPRGVDADATGRFEMRDFRLVDQPFLDQFTEIDAEIPVQRDHGHIDPGIYSDPNRILAALGDMIPLI